MIYIVCATCKAGLRIGPGAPNESKVLFGDGSDYYPDKYPCFRCEKPEAKFVPAMSSEALSQLELFDVTPMEAFAAMNGLGIPGEQDCSAAAVAKVMAGSTVKQVNVRQIRNSHRCLIDGIVLDNGVTLFMGSSALGATVYRVSLPHSYAEKTE